MQLNTDGKPQELAITVVVVIVKINVEKGYGISFQGKIKKEWVRRWWKLKDTYLPYLRGRLQRLRKEEPSLS